VDKVGNIYIADSGNYRVRKISPDGLVTTVAGNGTPGYSGDGGPATHAQLDSAAAVTIDSQGNLYIAEDRNHRVRKVSPGGIITTVAGNGTYGYSGDGGPATSAQVGVPLSVAVDRAGRMSVQVIVRAFLLQIPSFPGLSTAVCENSVTVSAEAVPYTGMSLSWCASTTQFSARILRSSTGWDPKPLLAVRKPPPSRAHTCRPAPAAGFGWSNSQIFLLATMSYKRALVESRCWCLSMFGHQQR
jgi:hypothetical protein